MVVKIKVNKKHEIEKAKLERATCDDIIPIDKLIRETFGEDEGYSMEYYINVISQKLSYIFKLKGNIIAICLIDFNEEDLDGICISCLCVKKEYRHKGLGRKILSFCIDNCICHGFEEFYLHVATTNINALKLYTSLGFEPIKVLENYYDSPNPEDNDAYLMVLYFL